MKCKLLMFAVIVGALGLASANFGGNQTTAVEKREKADKQIESDLLGILHQLDGAQGGPFRRLTKIVRIGDMVQLSVPGRKSERLRTVKLEITGKSATVVGDVVEWSQDHFACFLKPEKVGTTTVKITPVGLNGIPHDAYVFVLQVEKPLPPLHESFIQINTEVDAKARMPEQVSALVGDWIQFHVICSTEEKRGQVIRHLKVDVVGESVVKMAVLAMKVPTELSNGTPVGDDRSRRNLNCLVKAVKKGEAKVTIVPITEDGKAEPARVFSVKVTGEPKLRLDK